MCETRRFGLGSFSNNDNMPKKTAPKTIDIREEVFNVLQSPKGRKYMNDTIDYAVTEKFARKQGEFDGKLASKDRQILELEARLDKLEASTKPAPKRIWKSAGREVEGEAPTCM